MADHSSDVGIAWRQIRQKPFDDFDTFVSTDRRWVLTQAEWSWKLCDQRTGYRRHFATLTEAQAYAAKRSQGASRVPAEARRRG